MAHFLKISVIIDKQPTDTNHRNGAEKTFLKNL